jgi:hypothetical protein
MGTHWMIFLTIGNLVCSSNSLFAGVVGGAWPAPSERKDVPVLSCYGNGDLIPQYLTTLGELTVLVKRNLILSSLIN